MPTALSRTLSPAELDQLAAELDAVRARAVADLGAKDARYIRRIVAAVRYTGVAGRALLFASVFPPAWVLGTLLLGLSKILENMELGHNVMHGQYDWMGDATLNGQTYECDIDELAIALIELAGSSLRRVLSEARQRASSERSVVRSSLEVFMEQLNTEAGYLHLLLREGRVGSEAFMQAVDRQLVFFEEELKTDLIRLEQQNGNRLHEPGLVARGITRLVFAMGSMAMNVPADQQGPFLEQTAVMLNMLLAGARAMGRQESHPPV